MRLVLPTCAKRIAAAVASHARIAVDKRLRTLRLTHAALHVCAAGIQVGHRPLR